MAVVGSLHLNISFPVQAEAMQGPSPSLTSIFKQRRAEEERPGYDCVPACIYYCGTDLWQQ